jgi:hypothetical protein
MRVKTQVAQKREARRRKYRQPPQKFFQYPAVIQNMIYNKLVVRSSMTHVYFNEYSMQHQLHPRRSTNTSSGHQPRDASQHVQGMSRMSLVCRQMRSDVRSYLYTHNRFVFHVLPFATRNYEFLRDIKSDGRRHLHRVYFPELQDKQWPRAARLQLLTLLAESSNLQELTLCLELYTSMAPPALIWPNMVSQKLFDQMEHLKALTNISVLVLMCDFNINLLPPFGATTLNTLRNRVKSDLRQLARDITSHHT